MNPSTLPVRRPSAVSMAAMPLPMVNKIPRVSSVVLPLVSNLAVFDQPSKLTEQNLLNLSRAASYAASAPGQAHPGSARAAHASGTSGPMQVLRGDNQLQPGFASAPLRAGPTTPSNGHRSLSDASSHGSPSSHSSQDPLSVPTSPALSTSPKIAMMDAAGHTKRRQRLGPSCDSCRLRKVKCDADIMVLAKTPQEMNFAHFKVSSTQINNLFNNNTPIKLEDDSFVLLANDKVIKFAPCKSCSSKGLPCAFSKGFTKEDIIINSKKSDVGPSASRPAVAKVTKPRTLSESPVLAAANLALGAGGAGVAAGASSRKSSCSSCRRRKVKCVFNTSANKCDGCLKKSASCSYDM